MMLRWSLGLDGAASAIESAVSEALDDGYRTRDLLRPGTVPEAGDGLRHVGTTAMADAVIERISIRWAAPAPVAARPS